MSRLEQRFAELKAEGRSALVTFVTAGDPGYDASLQILKGLPAAGADVIELGMPFTDPMADGVAIQLATLRALEAGQTLVKTLQMVREFRVDNQTTPIVLMGYYNPIHRFGVDTFVTQAKEAGVDGLIIVDLPPEHDAELATPAQAAGIDFIRLTTPTTDDARLPRVLERSSGFVYYVSVAGVTGAGSATTEHVTEAIARLRRRYRSADQRWLRHSHAGTGCEHCPLGGWCGGGLGTGRQDRPGQKRRSGGDRCIEPVLGIG